MTRQTPRQALAENKSLLKWRPPLDRWRPWRSALAALLDQVKESETEEFHKTLVRDYLTVALRGEGDKTCPYFINVKNYAQGGGDLVVHGGKTAESPVAAILELKRPGDGVAETPKPDRLNSKALRQLVFYFLQERLQGGNLELKRLVISNLYEWFIFDAAQFERLFVERLEKRFLDFQSGRLTGRTTDYFYENIAQPAIAEVEDQLKFVYVDLRDYESIIREETDEQALTDLFKVFAPEYWLKLPSANDSNRLDEGFYSELLHLMGLTVVKSKGKKLIQRLGEKERLPGSLLENAISQIQSLDKLASLDDPLSYGDTEEEQLFGAALALVIVWVNRVLFLKLLEAQLLSYHREERDLYRFLNGDQIKDYGALQQLFFEVLAVPAAERSSAAQGKFPRVPYLNSSLFEMTDLERRTIVISNLQNEELPVVKGTVLLDDGGKPRTGSMSALAYLFAFLNAYDFGSGETGLLKQDQKRLINSSVLGRIFERINGYKDGSYFTPGFITMYMCRETIRRAVLQKFREVKGWDCADLTDLRNRIHNRIDDVTQEANEIVNSLKICDPAVGSGHFLVSALNEMIAIKSELIILMDRSGMLLKGYHIAVVDDELVILDEKGDFFEYHPGGRESQRVQEALFHEKQTVIEGCLFGVDINKNSVQICCLRLWIELLKNAYYRTDEQLETLPNIDINIKHGNSLISKFSIDSDLKSVLFTQKSQLYITDYKNAVHEYFDARSKKDKKRAKENIKKSKEVMKASLPKKNHPKKTTLDRLENELSKLENFQRPFSLGVKIELDTRAEKLEKEREKKITKLRNEIDKLRATIEEEKSSRLYDNALEWRFEFPEVLTDEGDFVGFDVVIGNPPYISNWDLSEKNRSLVLLLEKEYSPYLNGHWDLFSCFVVLAQKISTQKGLNSYILPTSFYKEKHSTELRKHLLKSVTIFELLDFQQACVFEDVARQTGIYIISSSMASENKIKIKMGIESHHHFVSQDFYLQLKNYAFKTKVSDSDISLYKKIKKDSTLLGELVCVNTGVVAHSKKESKLKFTKDDVIYKHYESGYKKYIVGLNLSPYTIEYKNDYIDYESKQDHFHRPKYPLLFESEKIIVRRISGANNRFIACYDDQGYYSNDNLMHLVKWNTEILNFQKPEHKWNISLNNSISIKYILSVLNSKICTYYFEKFLSTDTLQGTYSSIYPEDIRQIPIKNIDLNQQIRLINLVDQILDAKKADPKADTSALEAEIDRLVYELYGLTEEEIAIIENSQ
ncbi:MAG: hypothetical protein GC158_05820 [Cyanobacteria bacterium RI_101]|nr:hypothetical protein [Cyanobacteria bacterium RI_101]